MSRIGLDVGGTKSEVLALRADGSEALRTRVASPRDYGALVDAIAALVAQADSALGVRGAPVGIGAPGSPNPQTGLHRNSNLLCMNGKPFAADIATRLARPVRVTNDANCLALSEAIDGAAAGQGAVVFGVILGTGVGGGVVVRGDVVDGGNGIAGEWGHNPLPGLGDADAAARRRARLGWAGPLLFSTDTLTRTNGPLRPHECTRVALGPGRHCGRAPTRLGAGFR